MGDQSDDWLRTLATVPGLTALPPGNLQTMVNLLRFGPFTSGTDGPSWADFATQPPGMAATSAPPPLNFSQGTMPNIVRDGYNSGGTSWADLVSNDPSGQSANSGRDIYASNGIANGTGSGDRLTDAEIANIIFNETRSLSGSNIDLARYRIAQAVINGDERMGAGRPRTAPTVATVPAAEQGIYKLCQAAVAAARADRGRGIDPTHGAMFLNFRNGASTANRSGEPLCTQTGPFNNSYPKPDLGKTNVYSNIYGDPQR